MIKKYAVHTIYWEQKELSGYGVTYKDPITIDNCYIEYNVRLSRGQDDANSTNTLIILFESKELKQGDILLLPNDNKYIITQSETYYKPRSTVFDHLEIICGEISNES